MIQSFQIAWVLTEKHLCDKFAADDSEFQNLSSLFFYNQPLSRERSAL